MRRQQGSWCFGEFTPTDEFSPFAPLFGRWSLLIHADGADERLSSAASEELRETERALDQLRAKLFLAEGNKWYPLAQVNIDGSLIEWKEA